MDARLHDYCAFSDKSVRILQFLGHNCAYIVIFYWNLKELQDPWWRIWSLNDSTTFGIHNTSHKKGGNPSVCRFRQFLTSYDLNVWKFQQQWSQKKDQSSSLCYIRQFLPQMIWMFGIPATMVLNWLVLNLYPLFFFTQTPVRNARTPAWKGVQNYRVFFLFQTFKLTPQ